MSHETLSGSPRLKLDVMFDGVRYTEALAGAAAEAYPNYYPYRFQDDEPNPTGQPTVPIPYLMRTPDETMLRVKGNGHSPWRVEGDADSGYRLLHDDGRDPVHVEFEPRPAWMDAKTSDGFPMAHAGVSLHADMAVINLAPGCEYFLHKDDGRAMRCIFCSYGAPDERTAHLGQAPGRLLVPELTHRRCAEALGRALDESPIRNIYLVGGSLTDWRQEGERFLDLARHVREANPERIPVSCGSGALPHDILDEFHRDGLVENVCFNLEVWSEPLFEHVCPGKNCYVGYDRWIASLEHAVSLWGPGHVYSAMVAGVELEPELEMDWETAAETAIRGAEDLCSRGIIPVYSLYWPVGGRNHPDYMTRLRSFFETLNLAYADIRRRHGLAIWDGFMSHRSAYMQLECDLDRQPAGAAA